MSVKRCSNQAAEALNVRPERLEYLENWLEDRYQKGHIRHLVIKLLRYGTPIFEGTFGDDGQGGPLTADTIYPVASITKPIVSVLLHILQEDGLLDMAEPVGQFLPLEEPGKAGMTIMQLLTHTSGMIDEDLDKGVDAFIKDELGIPLPEEGADNDAWNEVMNKAHAALGLPEEDLHNTWTRIAMKLPNSHPPRTVMSYCNTGYRMLKEVIDKVTGEPIDVFAGRRLFGPLGMVNTHFVLPEEKWALVVRREEDCEGYPYQNTPDNFKNDAGSGGLKTTANDILRFAEMIRCGGTLDGARILSPVTVRSMTQNHNADLPNSFDAWALGFNIRCGKFDDLGSCRPASTLDHGGWGGTKMVIDRENGVTAALFNTFIGGFPYPIGIFGRMYNILCSALDDEPGATAPGGRD